MHGQAEGLFRLPVNVIEIPNDVDDGHLARRLVSLFRYQHPLVQHELPPGRGEKNPVLRERRRLRDRGYGQRCVFGQGLGGNSAHLAVGGRCQNERGVGLLWQSIEELVESVYGPRLLVEYNDRVTGAHPQGNWRGSHGNGYWDDAASPDWLAAELCMPPDYPPLAFLFPAYAF
jgi:hypothetical protein